MILLYIIGILCSLVLFAPSVVPAFVKWPVALLVVLLIVFFFNLPKKDTIYTVHENKKRILNYGLFNPLIMYISASIYILGFTLIVSHLQLLNITDFVSEFSLIIDSFEPSLNNNLFCGLIFVVLACLIYFIRNGFKNNASESSLKFRSFWYVLLTIIALLVGIFNFDSFYNYDIYEYLATGYNLYIYAGIAGLVVLIDLIAKLIVYSHKKKKAKKALLAANPQPEVVEEKPAKKVKKYKKPSFWGFLIKLVIVAAIYVGLYFGLNHFVPDFDFFGTCFDFYGLVIPFGYVLGGLFLAGFIMDIILSAIIYRASVCKKSKFLIVIYALLSLCALAVFLISGKAFSSLYVVFDDYIWLIIAGAFALGYILGIVSLITSSKKIYKKACGCAASYTEETNEVVEPTPVVEEVVEEKPLTKKEAKLAKKEAKKAKVIAKERARMEKKLAKKEAKINKQIKKREAKLAKKEAKLAKKTAPATEGTNNE